MKGPGLFYGALIVLTLLVGALLVSLPVRYQHFYVNGGAMKPELGTGYLFALRTSEVPERGEVVFFRHPDSGHFFFMRLIGLPGDVVEMRAGRLVLNGGALPQTPLPDHVEPFSASGRSFMQCANAPVPEGGDCIKSAFRETLPEGASYTILDVGQRAGDDFGPVTVKPGHFFVLGDNRDNSADSRFATAVGGPGQVPVENITGHLAAHLPFGR